MSSSSTDMSFCTGCDVCTRQCPFLQESGNPGAIAENPGSCDPFACTLCGLCTAVCPEKLDPAQFFLQLREGVRRERGSDDPRHAALLAYERKGSSSLFRFQGIPHGCDTVFFPGCALPGASPHSVLEVYRHLREKIPSLGVVLDCCLKPSHDLGRRQEFASRFEELCQRLRSAGVRKVLVACPNCHRIFSDYGEGLQVQTVYELLELRKSGGNGEVVIHDPCVARFHRPGQDAVRRLAAGAGLTISEMPHARELTLCCGKGGGACFIAPALGQQNVALRLEEAADRPVVTYCASCAAAYGTAGKSVHILDVWSSPAAALAGKVKPAKPPFTYVNRLYLKARLQKELRLQTASRGAGKVKAVTAVLVVLLVVAAAFLARRYGLNRLLEPEVLRQAVAGYGNLAPLLFIGLYTVTPVLFLPGLPMTVAAGILFGPFWGVVYAITGATLGACASFLVGRFVARDWIEQKLSGDSWQNLDRQVGEQGWKIVAVTRLVPLFPFNLLNYAFGLTRIGFIPYAVTSFICMLPACIAYVAFSSSLPDLLKGRISPSLVAGILLVAAVSAIPAWYRKKTGKK